MTNRQTSMLISSAYKIHCSLFQKQNRFSRNKINYKKWLKNNHEKDTKTNKTAFRKSHHYLRTLPLDEFAVKTLKALPEIDL